MKTSKLFLKLQNFFNPEYAKNKSAARELKIILKKLKKKEGTLIELLDQIKDPELQKLYRTELEIIRIQRAKGLVILQDIREKLHKKALDSKLPLSK